MIKDDEDNSSFAVNVAFPTFAEPDPEVDLDIYVYRIRDNGTLDPNVIASAASLDDPEVAGLTATEPGQPLRHDEYIVAVHNYCSAAGEARLRLAARPARGRGGPLGGGGDVHPLRPLERDAVGLPLGPDDGHHRAVADL